MSVAVGAELVLEIKDWAPPQGAVGFWGDIAIFVPYVIPGELVKVRVTQRKKNWALAEPLAVLQSSAQRQSPACQHFTECGGCDYQMISYPQQLEMKKELVLKQARRAGIAPSVLDGFSAEGIRPSPTPLGYRRRIRGNIKGGKFFLTKKNSHERVRIQQCLLLHPRVMQSIDETCGALKDGSYEWDLADPYSERSEVCVRPYVSTRELPFSQVNPEVNHLVLQELRHLVRSVAAQAPGAKLSVLELYAGSGNLTSALVEAFANEACPGVALRITAIEENLKSVELGRYRFSPELVHWIHSPVEIWLAGAPKRQDVFDLLLLDPPRAGLNPEVIGFLQSGGSIPWVIYMSCDLMTWARDVRKLSEAYEVVSLHAFDMFPQTHHVEILSLLRRKKGV